MEAVLILSEIGSDAASAALVDIARSEGPDELRAAAVWGLGQRPDHAADLASFLGDANVLVSVHAVVAMSRNVDAASSLAAAGLLSGDERQAVASAVVLARQGGPGIAALLDALDSARSEAERDWAMYGLGLAGRSSVEAVAGADRAVTLAETLGPVWRGAQEWLSSAEAAKMLSFIGRQSSKPPEEWGTPPS
jgi:HEAT repeat protein